MNSANPSTSPIVTPAPKELSIAVMKRACQSEAGSSGKRQGFRG